MFSAGAVKACRVTPVVIKPHSQIEGGDQSAIDDDGSREIKHLVNVSGVGRSGKPFSLPQTHA